jgi:hypothetical protein
MAFKYLDGVRFELAASIVVSSLQMRLETRLVLWAVAP